MDGGGWGGGGGAGVLILRFGERGLSLGGEELGRGWVACDRVLVAIGLDLGDLLRSAAVGSDANCIFCKIVAGQIPCHKVYEDEVMLAFLDIGPIVRGHTLVIPKEHFGTVMETPGAVMAVMGARLPALVRAVLAATGTKACHVLLNNGAEASQSVGHLHYHILPRRAGDGYHVPWPAGKLEAGEAAELKGGILRALGEGGAGGSG